MNLPDIQAAGKSGKREFLPKASRRIVIQLEVCAFVVLLILEFVVLPPASGLTLPAMQVNSQDWVDEDRRINANNSSEIIDDGSWLWQTEHYRVAEAKSTRWRILVMGDSFVWGDGYGNFNDLWWRQLQRELIVQGYQVEVIAAGVRGASTHQQFDHVQGLAKRYQPDLVIWGYVTNDPDEGLVKQQEPAWVLYNDAIYNAHVQMVNRNFFPRINFQLGRLRKQKLQSGFPMGAWELELLKGENLARYKKTLQSISDWSRESGIPFFFLTLPSSPELDYFPERYDRVKEAFDDARIPFYSTIEAFNRRYPDQPTTNSILRWGINPANGHPGPASTLFNAQQAVDILERNYPWILSENVGQEQTRLDINQWRPWNLDVLSHSETGIQFIYPRENELMLRMPFGEPYVQFNFASPAAIEKIVVRGANLKSATLYYTSEDPSQMFESVQVVNAGQKKGGLLTWSLAGYDFKDHVNTVRVSAGFSGDDRLLDLEFLVPEGRR